MIEVLHPSGKPVYHSVIVTNTEVAPEIEQLERLGYQYKVELPGNLEKSITSAAQLQKSND
jgi:hypothetical protein